MSINNIMLLVKCQILKCKRVKFNLTYNDNKLNFYSNITINSAPVAKSSP